MIFHICTSLCIKNLFQIHKCKKWSNENLRTIKFIFHEYFLHMWPTLWVANSKPNEYKQSTKWPKISILFLTTSQICLVPNIPKSHPNFIDKNILWSLWPLWLYPFESSTFFNLLLLELANKLVNKWDKPFVNKVLTWVWSCEHVRIRPTHAPLHLFINLLANSIMNKLKKEG